MGTEEKIRDKILEESKKGNIIVATFDGLQGMPLDEFIKQPTDGLLYDLNRDEATILTFIEDPKWVNDYAVCKVIRALKNRIEELEVLLADKKESTLYMRAGVMERPVKRGNKPIQKGRKKGKLGQ